MNALNSFKRAACGLLFLVGGVVARADNGVVGPGWHLSTAQNNFVSAFPAAVAPSRFSIRSMVLFSSGSSATTITPELQALATNLDNDPVKIYNYVHNQIEYQPYYGSLKGAQVTYLDGAGNDLDQASLLIALLNQAATHNSAIGATNYVFGTYIMPDRPVDPAHPTNPANNYSLSNWLGVVPSAAPSVLVQTGIPTGPPLNEGSFNLVKFVHYWVEVTINGTVYALDPSFKLYQRYNAIDFKTASGYVRGDLLATAGGATDGTNYVQNMSRGNVETKLGQYATNLRTFIQNNYPNVETDQIIGGGHVLPFVIAALGQGAPPPILTPTPLARYSTIPLQDPFGISIRSTYEVNVDSGAIDETFYTDSLQGLRLSLVFDNSAVPQGQLWLGDTMVAQESSGSGTTAGVVLLTTDPNPAVSQQRLPLTGSTPYNRGTGLGTPASYVYDLTYSLYTNPRSSGQINESTRQIQNYLASGKTDTSREVLTETLHSLGLKWARRVALSGSMAAKAQGVFFQLSHVFGRTGQEAGYYVDMPGVAVTIIDAAGAVSSPAVVTAFNSTAFLASAMEHGVIEQSTGTIALSTIKCLALANDQGQRIFRADTANYSSFVQPILTANNTYSSTDLATITNAINNGDTMLLHENGQTSVNPADPTQWKGFGYADFSPIVSGNTFVAMIIGGGFPGGINGGYASTPGTLSGTDSVIDFNNQSQQAYFPPQLPEDTSEEPVDLLTGAYTMEHTDLALGESGSPRGLNFTRYYNSSRNFVASPLGNGWRHSCEGFITLSSEVDNAFGLTQPTDATQTMVGAIAAGDFATSSSLSPQELLVGALTANWTVNRITNNAANVQLGNDRVTYESQPDGSWNPPPGSTTTLTGASGSFSLHSRLGGTTSFDSKDRISQSADADGNTQTYNYDGSGNLQSVTDAFGRALTFSYSGTTLQNVQDSTGRSVQFTYAGGTYSGSNLNVITDPAGYQTTLVYDSRNRLTDWKDNSSNIITHNDYDFLDRVYQQLSQGLSSHTWLFYYSPGTTFEIDPQGDLTAHYYDFRNREVGTIDPLGNISYTGYDGQNHVIYTIDATSRQTLYAYDGNQDLTSTADNNGKVTTYQYDASFRLQKKTDPTGRATQYGYDSHNHLTTMTDPGSRVTQNFYLSDGLLDHVVDPAGDTTTYAYDSYGNINQTTRADGTTTSATYNARGDELTATDGRGKTTTFTYDNRRLVLTAKDAQQNTATWTYDSNGNPATVTDRNGHTTTYVYDNLGHERSVQSLDTGTVTYSYDTRDWLTSVTDGLGNITSYGYDAAGRRVSVTNPLSIVTSQTAYDGAGRAITQTDGLGNATQFTYDKAGRLETSQDPLNHAADFTYDDAGRKETFTNKRGQTFGFGYAADGLPNLFSYPSGRESQVIDRDPHGLPKTLQSASGHQTALTYDAMARVKTSADGVGIITSTYDNNGNVTDVAETIGSGTTHIQRVYDNLGRVTSCTDTQGNTVGYAYDNEGNLATITYPDGKTVSYTYDGSNRLKTVTDWASRVTTYNYDSAGRLQTVVRPNNTQHRAVFDAASRLTGSYEELLSGGNVTGTLWQAQYSYDNANRLTTFTPTPLEQNQAPPALALTYDADSQLITYNGQGISHDLDGNLLSAPLLGTTPSALTWDQRNRLTSAGGVNYAYDAENRRVSSTTNGQVTTYVWSRGGSLDQLLVKQNPDGSVTRYVYGKGLLYEETTDAANVAQSPVYYHYDWRGDTVALSDANGRVTARMSYTPYGARTIISGTVNTPFCFNGNLGVMTEPSGLLAMQARFYSPVLDRFLNEDPSGFTGGSNMYAYASGDPVNLMDPFGLGPITTGQVLQAVGEGLLDAAKDIAFIAVVVGTDGIGGALLEEGALGLEAGAVAGEVEGAGIVAGDIEAGAAAGEASAITTEASTVSTEASAATAEASATSTGASSLESSTAALDAGNSDLAAESEIPTIGGRQPINSAYAGSTHPSGVEFTNQGFPDFSPYSKAEVEIEGLTGNYSKDAAMANDAAGLESTPEDYVWHHVEDAKTMQLIPKGIHNAVRHTGGAAVIRNGGFDLLGL